MRTESRGRDGGDRERGKESEGTKPYAEQGKERRDERHKVQSKSGTTTLR